MYMDGVLEGKAKSARRQSIGGHQRKSKAYLFPPTVLFAVENSHTSWENNAMADTSYWDRTNGLSYQMHQRNCHRGKLLEQAGEVFSYCYGLVICSLGVEMIMVNYAHRICRQLNKLLLVVNM